MPPTTKPVQRVCTLCDERYMGGLYDRLVLCPKCKRERRLEQARAYYRREQRARLAEAQLDKELEALAEQRRVDWDEILAETGVAASFGDVYHAKHQRRR